MNLRTIQQRQPWTVPYSPSFVEAGRGHPEIYAEHTILHAIKSLGKIASVLESVDHGQCMDNKTMMDSSADLVTAAIRLANLYGFDLEQRLIERVFEKNGVDISKEETTSSFCGPNL
jgi:hypothetical protein